MKIWILAVGEPSPLDYGERLHRSGLMAEYYSNSGHDVVLFNSTFFHQKKINRYSETTIVRSDDNLDLIFLWGREYHRNIDPSRILSNFDNARSFKKVIKDLQKPDIIIISFPILELLTVARKYAVKKRIPFIIDVRDFWPDVFYGVLPRAFDSLVSLLFSWFNFSINKSINLSNIIISPFQSGIEWSKKRLKKKAGNPEMKVIPFTTPERHLGDYDQTIESRFENAQESIVVAYLGTISNMADTGLILELARRSQELEKDIKFLICGDGPTKNDMEKKANGLNNIEFKGWVNENKISEVLKYAHFGILTYQKEHLIKGVPNKFSDYLSFRLPIITNTKGAVGSLLNQHDLGIFFSEKNIDGLLNELEEVTSNKKKYISKCMNVERFFNDNHSRRAVFKMFDDLLD